MEVVKSLDKEIKEDISKSLSAEETESIQVVKSKYMKMGNQKILIPKAIVKFAYDDFEVYGDSRCNGISLSIDMLNNAKEKDEIIIILRTTKKKKGDSYAFTQTIENLKKLRKWRLVNVSNLHDIAKQIGKTAQTMVEFMEQYVGSEFDSEDELKDRFLNSTNPDLIIADIKRMINLFYQEQNNANRLSIQSS